MQQNNVVVNLKINVWYWLAFWNMETVIKPLRFLQGNLRNLGTHCDIFKKDFKTEGKFPVSPGIILDRKSCILKWKVRRANESKVLCSEHSVSQDAGV